MIKVAKFGGSSMADGRGFAKVAEWIRREKDLSAIVLSAGGKTQNSEKVTDILIECAKKIERGESVIKSLSPFFERVKTDAESVGLYNKINNELMRIGQKVDEDFSLDFLLSRGEYIYGLMFSFYVGIRFVDSKDLIIFHDDGRVNYGYTEYKIKEEYEKRGRFITGGFYGGYRNGKIKTFSRGGGDFSGAIVSRSLSAKEYLNFTDVDGIYSFNPQMSENAKIIERIDFNTVRRLGEFGASVFHPASVLPLIGSDTKIIIKNTFNFNARGTEIFENCKEKPFAVAMKDCKFVKVKKTEKGYALIKSIAQSGVNVVFLNCNLDFLEVCFLGEIDGDEIIKTNNLEFFGEDSETKVFYFSPCEKSMEILSEVAKVEGFKGMSVGENGGYACVKSEDAKKVIETF